MDVRTIFAIQSMYMRRRSMRLILHNEPAQIVAQPLPLLSFYHDHPDAHKHAFAEYVPNVRTRLSKRR